MRLVGVCWGILLFTLFIAGAEMILRQKGFDPWHENEVSIQVDPGGKFFRVDSASGWTHLPGRFLISLATGYSFHASHLPNTLRITHPIESNLKPKSRDEIWIFGCSFTYGWSLNDEDTFPWLLQDQYPDYEVMNFGVNGYGTVQSLKQFQGALRKGKPKLVVLIYSDLHDERNTFLRNWIKALAPWNRLSSSREAYQQPYARLASHGELVYSTGTVTYVPFPFIRYSAFVHFLEQRYNELEERLVQSHEVSKRLVNQMAELARSEGVTFAIAGIHGGSDMRDMLDYAQDHGIANADISVNLGAAENTNRPHDPHPSAIANRAYAGKLAKLVDTVLLR